MTTVGVDYKSLRVLIVEDEAYTRVITRTLLRQIGVKDIAEATNGGEGLLKVAEWEPHIVLCDIHMSPINGLEFLEKLRQHPQPSLRNTGVIFLTADSKPDTVKFAKENGPNGYLVKPISLNALKARLDAVGEQVKKL